MIYGGDTLEVKRDRRFEWHSRTQIKTDVGTLTQIPAHAKNNSPKLSPTHPNILVNSPKFLDKPPMSIISTNRIIKTNRNYFENFFMFR